MRGLNISGQATSTSNIGFSITGGCYAIGTTCVGGSSFTNTLANGGTATTTFYSGGVVFASSTGSGLLSQSSAAANFYWNETTKRLGLGTTTPVSQLHVNSATSGYLPTSGGASSINSLLSLSGPNNTSLLFGLGDSGAFAPWIQGASVNDLSLEYPISLNPNGGGVGIGTTSVQADLEILNAIDCAPQTLRVF